MRPRCEDTLTKREAKIRSEGFLLAEICQENQAKAIGTTHELGGARRRRRNERERLKLERLERNKTTVAEKETKKRRKRSPPANLGGEILLQKQRNGKHEETRGETIKHKRGPETVFDTTVSRLRLASEMNDGRERGGEREKHRGGARQRRETRREFNTRDRWKKP